MIQLILNTLLTVVVSSIAGGLVVWFKTEVKKNREKDEAYERAVRALIHDAFFRYCRYILKTGYLTAENLENLEHLHNSYREMNMNGAGEKMYNECKKLPIVLSES